MSPYIAFLIAAIVLAITPGPGIAYVVARAVSGGRREGLASCLGTAIGGLFHVLAAALGMSLLIAESALAFSIVKYVGAAYLVFLGLRMLLRQDQTAPEVNVPSQGAGRAFREGTLVETLNVKTALFFLAFLPQFVVASQPIIAQLVAMGAVCVFLNTAVDVVAVYAVDRLLQAKASHVERSRAKTKARGRMVTRASGITMLGLGAYLAFAKREV